MGVKNMKKKIRIAMIVILSAIVWLSIALMVVIKGNEYIEQNIPIDHIHRTICIDYIIPVGKECGFSIDIDGPEKYVSNINISTGSMDAEPIFTASGTNTTINTGKLVVNDQDIYISFDHDLDDGDTIIDEGEQIKYTVNMYSDNYQLIKRILCGLAVIAALPLIALVIYSINKNYENGYDERQLKAQGVAYMNAFFVTLFTAIVLGMVSMIMDDLPLTIYESSLITFMIGFATFVISADVKDAYFGFRKKRLPLAIVFGIVGIISLIVAVIGFANGLAGRSKYISVMVVDAVCFIAVSTEMIIKTIRDKKKEALEDEES